MGHNHHLKPVVHIGPSKTATTSLQDGVIPHLGRPYQIKPKWTWSLARLESFEPPQGLARDVIVSDESLGDFHIFPPHIIAARLAAVFESAVVVLVERDPVELFYSFFRQGVVNSVSNVARLIAKGRPNFLMKDANAHFQEELKKYSEARCGFFAKIRVGTTCAIFAKHFDVQVLPFNLLRAQPDTFVRTFADICGSKAALALPHANRAEEGQMEAAFTRISPPLPPDACARLLDAYRFSALTREREDFIRNWAVARRIEISVPASHAPGP